MEKETQNQVKKESSVREIEVNIAPLLTAVAKKLWLIILGAVLGALMFNVGTHVFIKPTYRSSFTAFVNNNQISTSKTDSSSNINISDIQASKELVQTYSRILTSNNVLMASAEFINDDMSYEQLSSCVSTEIEDQTQLIKVNVTTTNADRSYALAQAIATTSPTHMSQIVEGSSMKIVDAPQPPKGKYGPNYFSATLLGFMVGAVLMIAYVLIRYFRDDTIKGEGDLEGRYSMPVIGVIPNLNENKGSSYYRSYYGYYQSYESAQKDALENEKKREEK